MTEVFSAIRFEYAGRSGGWTDFTADVLKTPSPRVSGMGITGTGWTDRVGDAGTLTFSLDNSASNSQGTLGYYTTFSQTAAPRGLYIRLSFEYDNRRAYKFVGKVDVDGVKAVAGKYGPRRVDVKCTNWMGLAAAHQLNLVGYQTNKRYDEVVPMLLNNMGDKPFGILLDQGQETFPTVFDVTRTQTKTLGELQKLAYSEVGRIYMRGDFTNGGQLYGEARNSRQLHDTANLTNAELVPVKMADATDTLVLMATGDLTLMSTGSVKLNQKQRAILAESDVIDLKFSLMGNYFNRATWRLYPRTVDAAATSVLGSLASGSYITLTAGQQITDYRLQYTDPNNADVKINGIEMRQPIASTDYKMFLNSDATGTDLTSSLSIQVTYGTSEASYTLTNNSASTAYVTTLQAVGKGVRVYQTTDKIYTSVIGTSYSGTTNQIEFEMPYTNPNTTTNLFAYDTGNWNPFLTGYDYPEINSIESVTFLANRSSLNMFAFMYCEPGTEIRVTETISGVGTTSNPYFINGTSFEIVQGKYVKWTASLKWNGRY